jgi:prolyl oligopeptidase
LDFQSFRALVGEMVRALILLGIAATVAVSQPFSYPKAKKGDVIDDYFGTKVPDPYRWLEDADSPETVEWIKEENKLTQSYLQELPNRALFRDRLTKLLNFERYTVPSWEGHRYIYRKNDGLQNQSVIYTLKDLSDTPQVLLDPNTMAADGTIAIASTAVSDDGRLLAYGVAASGSDWNVIRVRDITTNDDLPDLVQWVKFSAPSWTKDSKGFFYSRFLEPQKSENQTFAKLSNQKVYYHRIGDSQEKDVVVYDRPDNPNLTCDGSVSHDGRYLFLEVHKVTERQDQLFFKDLRDPCSPVMDGPLLPVFPEFEAEVKIIGSLGNRFFVLTDLNAPKYKIVEIDLNKPDREYWKEAVPETKDLLESAALVGGKLIVNYLVDAKNELSVRDLQGAKQGDIPLPSIGTVGSLSGDVDRPELFYSFTSFLYPATIYRCDVNTLRIEVFKKPSVDFDPAAYETKQIFYSSKDGTRVPMFLVYGKALKLEGNNPVYLTGYGGFNISITPSFSTSYLSWIEKGGVCAVPNLRGGGEYGREWHEAGTKEQKQNVFDDFVAAAQTLINLKYTSAGKIAIAGGSNGGLLIGAALTQHPELFGAAVPQVGVLDMLRYQKFTIGWAWQSDYGSSDTAGGFRYLIKYSPLQNIVEGKCYPSTLITTGDHDDRVLPGHSFKFAATLQAAQGCGNPILIRIDSKAGHGSGKPMAKIIDEQSDVLAFMWNAVAGAEKLQQRTAILMPQSNFSISPIKRRT